MPARDNPALRYACHSRNKGFTREYPIKGLCASAQKKHNPASQVEHLATIVSYSLRILQLAFLGMMLRNPRPMRGAAQVWILQGQCLAQGSSCQS
jgi:hypothetical protein